jgi:hypothetical protein
MQAYVSSDDYDLLTHYAGGLTAWTVYAATLPGLLHRAELYAPGVYQDDDITISTERE